MAHIEVTEEELIAGSFPPICAKTGEPTPRLVDVKLVIMPRWSRLLLVLAVVPWLLARPFLGRTVVARLPLTDELAARMTKSRADLVAAMLGGLMATALGAFIPNDQLQVALVGVGFLLVIGTVVALVLGERDYGIDLRATPWDTVMLRRIHPRFRDALVRGEAHINEPTVREVIEQAQAAATAPDPWA